MITNLKEQNTLNISKLDDIIESIDNYLIYKLDNHSWRDKSNQSEAIIIWRKKFIECKENLNNYFNEITLKFNVIFYVKSQSDKLYLQIMEDIKSLSDLTTNTNRTITWMGDIQSTSSNINLVNIWNQKYKTDIEDIPKLLKELTSSLQKYNYWIAESEINKTLNYNSMGKIEQLLKDIVQENEMARQFRKCILEHKFNSLNIPQFGTNSNNQIEF